MLLTLSTTTRPATDLGYLLHKHPDRLQSFASSVGTATVWYPEASEERCTVALLLEVDPIGLVRGKAKSQGFALAQYVNDRPYAASSLLTVAMGRVFNTAMAGRCDARPDLVGSPLDLEIGLPAIRSPEGAALVERLFAPLGWAVSATPIPLDPTRPDWGASPYLDVSLSGTVRLADALSHLALLIPALDGGMHYWVGRDEVDTVVRRGRDWLAGHPERDLILRRVLAFQRELVVSAVGRLAETDDAAPQDFDNSVHESPDQEAGAPEPPASPARRARVEAVLAALRDVGAHRVVDMGCGEGVLVRELIKDPTFGEILAADVSPRALATAERRLGLDRMPDSQRARLRIVQSSLMYADQRVVGFDAMVLAEVIEHIDLGRLDAFEHNVFSVARPGAVIVTTPNADFNASFDDHGTGTFRHSDHRFEWTRAEFRSWAGRIAETYGYRFEWRAIGAEDPVLGPLAQLGLFTRVADEAAA